jgi:hypothetical protein
MSHLAHILVTFLLEIFYCVAVTHQHGYPEWPSPATWTGYGEMVGLGFVNTTFCYDASKSIFSKFFTNRASGFSQQIITISKKKYFACLGPADCWGEMQAGTCTVSDLPAFPFQSSQFENYSYVGTQTVQNFNGTSHRVETWVGTIHGYSKGGPLPTIQYFGAKEDGKAEIRGNILIDEPGWVTEIRWFDDATPNVKPTCFVVPDSCK